MRIVVASLKGGVGKTTTAVYLAAVAARGRRQVTVVDADPQGSAAVWLEQRPIEGVGVVEAPSERLLRRALGADDGGAVVIVDTPPASERLTSTALAQADAVVVPTRIGGIEGVRLSTTFEMVPEHTPAGVVVSSARPWTRDFRETLDAWGRQGLSVWAVVPERVAIAAGPDAELHFDGLEAAGLLWRRLTRGGPPTLGPPAVGARLARRAQGPERQPGAWAGPGGTVQPAQKGQETGQPSAGAGFSDRSRVTRERRIGPKTVRKPINAGGGRPFRTVAVPSLTVICFTGHDDVRWACRLTLGFTLVCWALFLALFTVATRWTLAMG